MLRSLVAVVLSVVAIAVVDVDVGDAVSLPQPCLFVYMISFVEQFFFKCKLACFWMLMLSELHDGWEYQDVFPVIFLTPPYPHAPCLLTSSFFLFHSHSLIHFAECYSVSALSVRFDL